MDTFAMMRMLIETGLKRAVGVILFLCLGAGARADVRLLTGDGNGNLHDRDSFLLDVSADGNLAIFTAGPPVVGSTPGITRGGLYMRNLRENTLEFVGVPVGGENNNDPTDALEASMSDDGRYFAWASVARSNVPRLIFWRDHQGKETRLVTTGADADSRRPIISADGRYVAFLSVARNLPVTPEHRPATGRAAVYLYDSVTGTTSVASLTHDGKGLDKGVGSGPGAYFEFDFSDDGRYVVFSTDSTGMHPSRASANQAFFWLYRRNVQNGQVDVVSRNAESKVPAGNFTSPCVDATGNRVLFTGGFVGLTGGPLLVNGYSSAFGFDLYLKDMTTEEVWWVTQTTNRTTSDAAFGAGAFDLSGDGKVAAYGSTGVKFVPEITEPPGTSDSFDIFRADIGPNGSVTNSLITKPAHGTGNIGFITGPILPSDGSYVAFVSRYHFGLIGVGEQSSIWSHGYAVGNLPLSVPNPSSPALTATAANGSLTFEWPDTAGFKLAYKTSLNQTTWTIVNATPTLQNGINSLTEVIAPGAKYFVLLKP